MLISTELIPFDSILSYPKWSLHPWDLKDLPHELHRSFATLGILHPPLVQCKGEEGGFEIISGARRIQYLRHNLAAENYSILCRVIKQDCDEKELLEIILEEQLCSNQGLSLAEKACFLKIALGTLEASATVLLSFGPRLQLKNGKRFIEKLDNLFDHDEKLLQSMHRGVIGETILWEILMLRSHAEQLAFIELVTFLDIGEGKQRRLLQMLRDLSLKEGTSMDLVLQTSPIRTILENTGLNHPQRLKHLLDYLQKSLHPGSTTATQQFKNEIEQLALPENCQITAAQAFEKDEVTLSVVFEDLDACKRHLRANGLTKA